jgi:hypothetical protein
MEAEGLEWHCGSGGSKGALYRRQATPDWPGAVLRVEVRPYNRGGGGGDVDEA